MRQQAMLFSGLQIIVMRYVRAVGMVCGNAMVVTATKLPVFSFASNNFISTCRCMLSASYAYLLPAVVLYIPLKEN
jgi:hypothetical protein